MIVVKIELHSAITKRVTLIGKMIICNRGDQPDPKRGNYDVYVGNKKHVDIDACIIKQPQRMGEVLDYPRLSYNVWRLIIRALKSAFPEEK